MNVVGAGEEDDVELVGLAQLAEQIRQFNANLGYQYNALNSNTATAYNQTYGPAWLTPTAVLQSRFMRFNVQVDF